MDIYTISYDNDCRSDIFYGIYSTPSKALASLINNHSDYEYYISKWLLNITDDYVVDETFKFAPLVKFNLVKNLKEFSKNKNIIIEEAKNEKYDLLNHLFLYKKKRNDVYEERRKAIIDKNNGLNLKINDHTDIYEKFPFPEFKN